MRPMIPFATLAALAVSGCATTGEPSPPSSAPPLVTACPPTRDWHAWINAMPGPDAVPTLIVTGEADLPAGMRAELSEGPLDRMMPPTQRFTLALQPGPRGGPAPGGWTQVRAEIRPAQPAYGAVLIGCGGKELARISPVETAH